MRREVWPRASPGPPPVPRLPLPPVPPADPAPAPAAAPAGALEVEVLLQEASSMLCFDAEPLLGQDLLAGAANECLVYQQR
jgi:hypothetical protein